MLKKIIDFFKGLFGSNPKGSSKSRRKLFVYQPRPVVYRMIEKTPGGHHALYETSHGVMRKPILPNI